MNKSSIYELRPSSNENWWEKFPELVMQNITLPHNYENRVREGVNIRVDRYGYKHEPPEALHRIFDLTAREEVLPGFVLGRWLRMNFSKGRELYKKPEVLFVSENRSIVVTTPKLEICYMSKFDSHSTAIEHDFSVKRWTDEGRIDYFVDDSTRGQQPMWYHYFGAENGRAPFGDRENRLFSDAQSNPFLNGIDPEITNHVGTELPLQYNQWKDWLGE